LGFIAVAVAVSVGSVLTSWEKDGISQPRVTPGQALVDPTPVGYHIAVTVPIPVVHGTAQVWNGEELLAFGSSPGQSSMVGYNPRTGDWRQYELPPFDGFTAYASAVWVQEQLVVVGIACPDAVEDPEEGLICSPGTFAAASFDPQTNSWDLLPSPDGRGAAEAIGAFRGSALFRLGDRYWVIDPLAKEWRGVSDPEPANALVCAVGLDSTIALNLDIPANPVLEVGTLEVGVSVSALGEDASTWLPRSALSFKAAAPVFLRFACGGEGALLYSSDFGLVWRYDVINDTWTPQASAPEALSRRQPPAGSDESILAIPAPVNLPYHAWTGDTFVFWDSDFGSAGGPSSLPENNWPGVAIAYLPETEEWRPAAPGGSGDIPQWLWADGVALYLTESADGEAAIATYNPR
jgi:hypothetical protein